MARAPENPVDSGVSWVFAMLFSLDTGLAADDYMLSYAVNGGTELPWSPLDASGLPSPTSPEQAQAARDLGLLPWTADPEFSFAFLRPLSLLSHVVDFTLWPGSAAAMHAHSVVWFGLFLAGCAVFVRRIEGTTWVAGLALLLLAVDDSAGPTVGWIANRNLVMAGAFGVWALVAYDRAAKDSGSAWGAPVLVVLALASNEGALGWAPLFGAYARWLDPRASKWRHLGVIASLYVAYLGIWVAGGFGVHGSGVYADFGRDPGGSIVQLLTNLPVLAMSLFTGVWAELFSFTDVDGQAVWLAIAWVCTLVAGVVAVRLARTDSRTAMWAVGAFGALLPVSASFPSDRLLLIASLPGAALLAKLIEHLRNDRRTWRIAGVVAALLLARHVGLNLLLAPLRARSMQDPQEMVERSLASLDLDRAEGDIVLLINPVSDALGGYAVMLRSARYQTLPATVSGLYSGLSAVTVERTDDRTLVLTPETPWMAHASEQLSRNPRANPFSAGDTVRLPGHTVHVEVVTADGRPARTRVVFDAPLEDERFHFYRYDVIDFAPFELPNIGENRFATGYRRSGSLLWCGAVTEASPATGPPMR